MQRASTDEQLTRYLLGELPESEAASLEEQYFGDNACFERMLALDDELVDDYVRGALSPTRRAQLGRRLRETGQWGRVQFARALSQKLGPEARMPGAAAAGVVLPLLRRRSEVLVGAIAAALLLFAGVAGWWFSSRIAALKGELARAEQLQRSMDRRAQELQRSVDAARAEKEAAVRQLNQARAEAQPPKAARFLLLGAVRGSGASNRVLVTPQLESVLLQVPGEEIPYLSYRGTLRSLGGDSLLQARLRPSSSAKVGRTLDLEVPSWLLTPGRYVLVVEGRPKGGKWEGIRDYPFEVIRK